jgi:PadR family transcriptional regulator, regulatory protein AphA
MPQTRLTETSYVVLGLVEHLQPATAYDLKRLAELSTFNFWSVPHSQLYAECSRLSHAGLLDEVREHTGRRRRIYRMSESGRHALESWRHSTGSGTFVLRDVGTLKLFFGADPVKLAQAQIEVHSARLEGYEELRERIAEGPAGWRLALEHGIGHEREFIRFWSTLAARESPIQTSPNGTDPPPAA